MSKSGDQPSEQPKSYEVRGRAWRINNILITVIIATFFVSIFASSVVSLAFTYFGPTVIIPLPSVSVPYLPLLPNPYPVPTSLMIGGIGLLGLFLSTLVIIYQFRPTESIRKTIRTPIFYVPNTGEIFPMTIQYYPQRQARQAFNIVTGQVPALQDDMYDVNPTFHDNRSVFVEFLEFLLVRWIHNDLSTYIQKPGLRESRTIEPGEFNERLQENTFIDYFVDHEPREITDIGFTQLNLELPKDVTFRYRPPEALKRPEATKHSFAMEIKNPCCRMEIFVLCNPGHELGSYRTGSAGGKLMGMPLDHLDIQKIQRYQLLNQTPIGISHNRVKITVEFSFVRLLLAPLLRYDPYAYVEWLESAVNVIAGGGPLEGWNWDAVAHRRRQSRESEVYELLRSIQQSLDEASDWKSRDEDFLEKHLETVEKQKERWVVKEGNGDLEGDSESADK